MKKKIFKRGMAGLLAVLTAFTTLIGMGTTAFAASETAESYMVSYPRDGDAVQVYDQSTWGHSAKSYMNGWGTQAANVTTIHCMDSYDGKVCYCIEPGVPRNVGDSYSGFGENFWDNYPSQYNNTIEPDDIKVLLGRIMQYGYQGNISTSWKSQNNADADKMAHAIATQLLVWETVIGERDADFNHVSTGGKDAVKSVISSGHPLKSRIDSYYNSIVSSVQSHVEYPSFMSKSTGKAKTIELEWDGSKYVAELTDTNNVLSKFTFSASATGFNFSVSGNKLTITTDNAPTGDVTITASRSVARCGVLVWTDNKYGPDGGIQDTVTYTASVSDPVKAFIKLKVSYGSAKIIKTSEDGKVDGIKFTVVGDGVNQTVTTNSKGEIQIDNLMPGTYTVTEQTYDKYVPQETHRVTVLAGQTATVSFNNVLRRGDLTVTKTSEDGLVEGVKFHLYGTSVSGLAVDEFAVTNSKGVATFKDVLIGSGYTLEEVDTAIRYVIPASQSAAVEWNSVTNKSFSNILKKFNVTVTKSDYETIKANNPYDDLEMSGSRAVWPEVLSVYAVKTTTDPDNPQEVASITEEKKQLLTDIFWEMNDISYRTETDTETEIIESDDGNGNILEETVEVTKTTLYITVSHKTAEQMSDQYRFNDDQDSQLEELLSVDNSMWLAVLYGIYGSDDMIVQVALSQIGNVGGEPYWSWYGFGSRVEWCACFVSWCADQCGYIETGVCPKYAGCVNGVAWFKEHNQWVDGSETPSPGMIIFYDWDSPNGESGPQDELSDHTGIVERVENGIVYTVEGNSGDSCRQCQREVGNYEILGYGVLIP